ncbi:MAG TPA: Gfo/Idh/MocA family oxidoreductase [Chloroflexota bacterium]|nr:Gfo/Idh/MocA family oxidoreductase [Chloroflexota bacterium]
MAQLGLGIIGTGRIAQSHLRSLARSTEGKALCVFDVIPERATQTAAEFGVPNTARTLDELLERRDVEACIVCTPPTAHMAPTVSALEAGKHVLCEKPFALDPSEAERMVQTAERNKRFLSVCSARDRVGIGPRTAHQLAASGALGKVYHVRSSAFRVRGRPGIDMFQDATWFIDKTRAGGGALIDIGVYRIDALLWYLGYPRVTSVLCSTYQGIGTPATPPVVQTVEDHAVVMFTCDNGASGVLEIAWASNIGRADTTLVLGTAAGLRFDPLTRITAGANRLLTEERLIARPDGDSSDFGDVTIQFVRAIQAGRQPETPAREALEVARVIDAAYRSAASGQAVSLVS